MYYSPFPYKLSFSGDLFDGAFVKAPSVCRKMSKSANCLDHYKEIWKSKSPHVTKCPNGFGSCCIKMCGQDMILTCLNVEKITDRKCSKRVESDQFFPRITKQQFESIIIDFQNVLLENIETNATKVNFEKKVEELKENRMLLENTLHEIRKINNQLKSSVEIFVNEYSKYNNYNDKLNSLCTDIYQSADLLTIRFDTYDFEVNPELNKNTIEINIPVFKRVEKIYKCLNTRLKDKNLKFVMKGNSYNLYHASNVLEIGLFILIDNAIKYSLPNSTITAKFVEVEDKLHLIFNNMGIRPNEDELHRLTERGFRSKKVSDYKKYDGRGIGLYLFKKICEYTKVEYKIKLGNENKYLDGDRYSPFMVELTFCHMIKKETNEK